MKLAGAVLGYCSSVAVVSAMAITSEMLKYPLTEANLVHLEDELDKAVGTSALKKQSPMFADLFKMINDTMAPAILTAHTGAQSQLDEFGTAFGLCVSPGVSTDSSGVTSKTIADKLDEHKQCRIKEGTAVTDAATCSADLKKHETVKNSACGSVPGSDGNAPPLDKEKHVACKVTPDDYTGWLNSYIHQVDQLKSQYDEAVSGCGNASKLVDDMGPNCKEANSSVVGNKTSCDALQIGADLMGCSSDPAAHAACERYGLCWENANSSYLDANESIAAAQVNRTMQWRVLKRMQCLLAQEAEGATHKGIDACREQTIDTSHLDLVYPVVLPKVDCSVPAGGPRPCTTEWIAEYGPVVPNAPRLPCTPCPQQSISDFKSKAMDVCQGCIPTVTSAARVGDKCGTDGNYFQFACDVPGWGTIDGKGHQTVEAMSDCRDMCDSTPTCMSFEWDPPSKNCNLNTQRTGLNGPWSTNVFCAKTNWPKVSAPLTCEQTCRGKQPMTQATGFVWSNTCLNNCNNYAAYQSGDLLGGDFDGIHAAPGGVLDGVFTFQAKTLPVNVITRFLKASMAADRHVQLGDDPADAAAQFRVTWVGLNTEPSTPTNFKTNGPVYTLESVKSPGSYLGQPGKGGMLVLGDAPYLPEAQWSIVLVGPGYTKGTGHGLGIHGSVGSFMLQSHLGEGLFATTNAGGSGGRHLGAPVMTWDDPSGWVAVPYTSMWYAFKIEQCMEKGLAGQTESFCNSWCNTGKDGWQCSLQSNWVYACDCKGCNGCV